MGWRPKRDETERQEVVFLDIVLFCRTAASAQTCRGAASLYKQESKWDSGTAGVAGKEH